MYSESTKRWVNGKLVQDTRSSGGRPESAFITGRPISAPSTFIERAVDRAMDFAAPRHAGNTAPIGKSLRILPTPSSRRRSSNMTSSFSQTVVDGKVVEQSQTENGVPVGPQIRSTTPIRTATPISRLHMGTSLIPGRRISANHLGGVLPARSRLGSNVETSAYSQTTVNGEVVERVQTRNGLPVGTQVASTLRGATPFTGGDFPTIATTEFPSPFVTGIDFPMTGIAPFPLRHQINVGGTVPAHAESTTTTTSHRFVNTDGETEERFTKTVDGEVVEDLHSKTTKDAKPREVDGSSDLVGPE